MWFEGDLFHRAWNSVKTALRTCCGGMWISVTCLIVAFNCNYGPWLNAGWMSSKREILQEYLATEAGNDWAADIDLASADAGTQRWRDISTPSYIVACPVDMQQLVGFVLSKSQACPCLAMPPRRKTCSVITSPGIRTFARRAPTSSSSGGSLSAKRVLFTTTSGVHGVSCSCLFART